MGEFLSLSRAVKGTIVLLVVLTGALGLLVALASLPGVSPALAHPEWGNTTEECLYCHKDPSESGSAVDLYMVAHDSSAGEYLACHEYEGESIHGPWAETPEACLACHSPAGWVPAPADHWERTEDTCLACHR